MNKFLNRILNILNQKESCDTICNSFTKAFPHFRGVNRKLIQVIRDIFSQFALPIRNNEKVLEYKNSNLNEELYEKLAQLILASECVYFNAVCGELLWDHYHEPRYAEIPLNNYMSELTKPSYVNDLYFTRVSLGICRIYKPYKPRTFDYESFCDIAIQYVQDHLDDRNFCTLFILNAILQCSENGARAEKAFKEAIEHFVADKDYSKAIGFAEDLEKYYRKNKHLPEAQKLCVIIATMYEQWADTDIENTMRANHHLLQAMNAWQRSDTPSSKSERHRLAKKAEPLKRKILQEMKVIHSEPLDISDTVNDLDTLISKSSLEETILLLAQLLSLKDYNVAKELFLERRQGLSMLFGKRILTQDGRTKCIIPGGINPTAQESEIIMESLVAEEYGIAADMLLKPALIIARKTYEFTETNLGFLVEQNAFIPSDRKSSFLKGIVAGFNMDFITAMHLLMPQVENAIRELAKTCDAVVYKTDAQGIEEALSLESALGLNELKDCLEDEILFNMKLFYTSKHGFGARNDIGHGLLSDNEIQSAQSLAVWAFTLYLVCLFCPELYKRVDKQKESKRDSRQEH